MNNMKLNKSPGLDGITAELYQTFWEEMKHIILRVFIIITKIVHLLTHKKMENSLIFENKENTCTLKMENY